MTEPTAPLHDNDQEMARLFAATGRRAEPPADVFDAARLATMGAWQEALENQAKRSRRQRYGALGLAAALVVAVTVALLPSAETTMAPSIASVDRARNVVEVSEDAHWVPAAVNTPVVTGQVVRTGTASGVSITLASGINVRLAANTRVGFVGPARLSLAQGQVYVDTGVSQGGEKGIVVVTPSGTARDIGTQFVVDAGVAGADMLTVSVREGSVEFSDGDRLELAQAGESLIVDPDAIAREDVKPDAPLWDWTQQIAPPFEIAGQTATSFLEWVARETGKPLRYEAPAARQAAAEMRLFGSIEGLTPLASLRVIEASSGGSLSVVATGGELVVGLR